VNSGPEHAMCPSDAASAGREVYSRCVPADRRFPDPGLYAHIVWRCPSSAGTAYFLERARRC
jgi:hypothetical protein